MIYSMRNDSIESGEMLMSILFEKKEKRTFEWSRLGDVQIGRGNLGEEAPVIVYRLMQFTMLDVLSEKHGNAKADDYFRDAGTLAGKHFAKNLLDLSLDFDSFIAHLQETLKILKIGILRMEDMNLDTGEIVLTVGEDLDCSGLPVTGENVCVYDEGFLKGILESYTGENYHVKELDCWASGARICRFKGVRETAYDEQYA